MKKILMISLLMAACSGEPDWMFDVQMCEAEGGFASVQDMISHTEVTCDYPEKESVCYAICKPYGDCPLMECPQEVGV